MNKETLNKNLQKFINWCLKYGSIIISIIILIIGISSIFVTAYFNSNFHHAEEKTSFKYSLGIIPIVISTICIILILFINKKILKKIPSKYIMIALSIFSLALYIFWINALRLTPENDQKLIHEMALHALDGDVSFYTAVSQYLFLYPYQFFFTFIVTIIYKIFGVNYLYIEYLNAICSTINALLLFFISKQIFKDEKIQKTLTLFIAGFTFYWMFFNVHFYGNILGLTLALFAILFTTLYLNTHKLRYTFFIGFFISFATLVKTNYQIFLVAIIICLLLDLIKKYDHKKLLMILLFILGFISIILAYKPILSYYNIDASKGVPMSNFLYMGMAEPTNLSPRMVYSR